jgi:TRAP-type C4-dicarboxylate transport system substrate-binding protein
MKTTKKLVLSLLVMAAAAGMVFAGGGGQAAAPAKTVVIFAGVETASTGQSRMMQETADKLNATGRFEASVQVNGALANSADDLVTQAKTGVPLVVPTDSGRLASQFNIPDLNILMAPYVLTDPAVLNKLPDTPIFKEWQAQLEQQGITLAAIMYYGFRSFYTTTPVSTVADLRGLRIRGFPNAIGNVIAKYLGFANIGIGWGEVPLGLQQNTLDGCEVQDTTAGLSVYEIAKYLALTKHYMYHSAFVCSTALLNKMPEADRKVFLDTIRETAKKYSNIIANEEDGYYQKMKEQGVIITEVNLADFQAAIAPLYTNNDLNFSDGLKDRLFRELGL